MRRYDFLFQITVYLSQTHKRKKQIDLSVDKKFVWILVSNYIILHVTQTHKRNKQIDKSVKRTTFLNTWMLKNRTHNMTSYKAWLFHKNLKCKKVYRRFLVHISNENVTYKIRTTYITIDSICWYRKRKITNEIWTMNLSPKCEHCKFRAWNIIKQKGNNKKKTWTKKVE